jgi:hypothetical protein
MANAVFTDKNNKTIKVSEKQKVTMINEISTGTANISQVLPFRVRFNNIGVRSYTASNPAPIGIAIIGLNNYIL